MNSDSQNKKKESNATAEAGKIKPISECRRCGTCCKKGGPSFHRTDKALIEKGVIHSKYLYTIRQGELAYDNVRQCLEPVSSDVIKLKGKGETWTCILFDGMPRPQVLGYQSARSSVCPKAPEAQRPDR
jgi:Fe-S-cluster containining protein